MRFRLCINLVPYNNVITLNIYIWYKKLNFSTYNFSQRQYLLWINSVWNLKYCRAWLANCCYLSTLIFSKALQSHNSLLLYIFLSEIPSFTLAHRQFHIIEDLISIILGVIYRLSTSFILFLFTHHLYTSLMTIVYVLTFSTAFLLFLSTFPL